MYIHIDAHMCLLVNYYVYIYSLICFIDHIFVVLRSKECTCSHLTAVTKGSNFSEGRMFVSCVCWMLCR